jgi:hypothetical protein
MVEDLERADLAFANDPGDLGGRFEMHVHGNSYAFAYAPERGPCPTPATPLSQTKCRK